MLRICKTRPGHVFQLHRLLARLHQLPKIEKKWLLHNKPLRDQFKSSIQSSKRSWIKIFIAVITIQGSSLFDHDGFFFNINFYQNLNKLQYPETISRPSWQIWLGSEHFLEMLGVEFNIIFLLTEVLSAGTTLSVGIHLRLSRKWQRRILQRRFSRFYSFYLLGH